MYFRSLLGELIAAFLKPFLIIDVSFNYYSRILYTEEANFDDLEFTQKLYYVANKYEVPFIENLCKDFFLQKCHETDLNETKTFAEMFCIKELIDLCDLVRKSLI